MKDNFIYADDIEVTKDMKEAFELYWYHHGDMDYQNKYHSQDWVTFRCAYNAAITNTKSFEKLYKSALSEAKQQYVWRQEDAECGSCEINEGIDMLECRIIEQSTKS